MTEYLVSSEPDYIPPPPPLPIDAVIDWLMTLDNDFIPYQPFEDWCRLHRMPTTQRNGGAQNNRWIIANENHQRPTILPTGCRNIIDDDFISDFPFYYISYHYIVSDLYRWFSYNNIAWPDSFHFTAPHFIDSNRTKAAMLTPCYLVNNAEQTGVRACHEQFKLELLLDRMQAPPATRRRHDTPTRRFTYHLMFTAYRDRDPTNVVMNTRFCTTRPWPIMPDAFSQLTTTTRDMFTDMLKDFAPRATQFTFNSLLPAHHPCVTYADNGVHTASAHTHGKLIYDHDQLVSAQRAILSPGLLFNMIAKSARRAQPNDFADAVKSQCEPGTDDLLDRYGPDIFVKIHQHLSDNDWPDIENILEASGGCDTCCDGNGCGDCSYCISISRVDELEEAMRRARDELDV